MCIHVVERNLHNARFQLLGTMLTKDQSVHVSQSRTFDFDILFDQGQPGKRIFFHGIKYKLFKQER